MKKMQKSLRDVNEIFVGVDLHKKDWVVSMASSEGEFLSRSTRIAGDKESLLNILQPYSDLPRYRIHIVYEAGCFGFWLCHDLILEGYDCTITPPSLIPTESGNKVKTDKRDSKKLALYLSKGLLKSIYVPASEELFDRELTRTRSQLVGHRADIERQIKSKLLLFGIELSSRKGAWTAKFISSIKEKVSDMPFKPVIESLLRIREEISKEIKNTEVLIMELAQTEKYSENVKIVKSVHGIGNLTAMIFLLELGSNLSRFKNSRQLCAYLGLTPSEFSTGEHIRHGNITRTGNKRIRSILVESSWQLINRDKGLRRHYEKLKIRRGGKRAIVAIARKLSCRIRQMLLNKEVYKLAA